MFVILAKKKFGVDEDTEVIIVFDDDGTEVDDEEYFQTMIPNTNLMLLVKGYKWTPLGRPFRLVMWKSNIFSNGPGGFI